MAFLAVTMFDSLAAVNPLLVMPSIFKMPLEYLLTIFLCGGALAVYVVGQKFLPLVMPGFVAAVLSNFVWLYLLVVEMRLLGVLYRARSVELGWFRRPLSA
jgi:hypothetical protein